MNVEEIRSVARGSKVFDLGVELFPGMPHIPLHGPFGYSMIREHGDLMYPEGACAAVDTFFCTGHTGTHIDALGHVSKDMKLHGGVDAASAQSKTGGLSKHGVETVSPIVRRGVLLDAAAHLKREALEPARPVTRADLEAAARAQGVRVEAGDVVLVRTGHIRHWPKRDFYHQKGGIPGVDLEAARWLADQGIFMLGGDNFAVEVTPAPSLPVHCHMLVERGIHLLEVGFFEELSRTRTYEFLLVALPLKIRGGTGSPTRPVAIV